MGEHTEVGELLHIIIRLKYSVANILKNKHAARMNEY